VSSIKPKPIAYYPDSHGDGWQLLDPRRDDAFDPDDGDVSGLMFDDGSVLDWGSGRPVWSSLHAAEDGDPRTPYADSAVRMLRKWRELLATTDADPLDSAVSALRDTADTMRDAANYGYTGRGTFQWAVRELSREDGIDRHARRPSAGVVMWRDGGGLIVERDGRVADLSVHDVKATDWSITCGAQDEPITDGDVPVNKVLDGADQADLSRVLVIGQGDDGLYAASSTGDTEAHMLDAVVWMRNVLAGAYGPEDEDGADGADANVVGSICATAVEQFAEAPGMADLAQASVEAGADSQYAKDLADAKLFAMNVAMAGRPDHALYRGKPINRFVLRDATLGLMYEVSAGGFLYGVTKAEWDALREKHPYIHVEHVGPTVASHPSGYDRIIITRHGSGFISVASAYAPRPGEDHERGEDIVDGRPPVVWRKIADLVAFLSKNPGKRAEDWEAGRSDGEPAMMDFGDALAAMKRGKAVRRVSWKDVAGWARYAGGVTIGFGGFMYALPQHHRPTITGADLLATDWQIVNDDTRDG